jgi:hypothetical protein
MHGVTMGAEGEGLTSKDYHQVSFRQSRYIADPSCNKGKMTQV